MADSAASSAASTELPYVLIVRGEFLDYQIGDRISDAATIKEILAGDMAVYVIKAAKAD